VVTEQESQNPDENVAATDELTKEETVEDNSVSTEPDLGNDPSGTVLDGNKEPVHEGESHEENDSEPVKEGEPHEENDSELA
jgi:hypothetical protein